jgi:hypothetical protein
MYEGTKVPIEKMVISKEGIFIMVSMTSIYMLIILIYLIKRRRFFAGKEAF